MLWLSLTHAAEVQALAGQDTVPLALDLAKLYL